MDMRRDFVGRQLDPGEVICPSSPTGKHFHELLWTEPRTASTRVRCDFCLALCRIKGALWAKDFYVIFEEPELADLL